MLHHEHITSCQQFQISTENFEIEAQLLMPSVVSNITTYGNGPNEETENLNESYKYIVSPSNLHMLFAPYKYTTFYREVEFDKPIPFSL